MFELVVRALIKNKNGDILLARRAKKPERGKWALVGGKVEMGEKVIDAVTREVKEELHIDFKPEFAFYAENFSDPNRYCMVFYFTGSYTGDMLRKPDEILETKFFSRKELDAEDAIAWDHREMIARWLA